MLTLTICCPSVGGHDEARTSWLEHATNKLDVRIDGSKHGDGAGFLMKLQRFYKMTDSDIIGYLHSDLVIHEDGWDERVLARFKDDPDVAVVSFGGSLAHGHPDIYKIPYDYRQLARSPFLSNLRDAEVHGSRETGCRDVAVIDSFAMFVRRAFLDRVGGWPVDKLPPCHCSDYWLSLMCHRHRQRIVMVGVDSTHASGGKTQEGFNYVEWAKQSKWGSDEAMHKAGHEWIYNEFRDVLPVEVK